MAISCGMYSEDIQGAKRIYGKHRSQDWLPKVEVCFLASRAMFQTARANPCRRVTNYMIL